MKGFTHWRMKISRLLSRWFDNSWVYSQPAASTSSATDILPLLDCGFDRLSRVSGTITVAELVEATRSSEFEPGG